MYTIHGIDLEGSARYLINVEGPNPGFVSRMLRKAYGYSIPKFLQYLRIESLFVALYYFKSKS